MHVFPERRTWHPTPSNLQTLEQIYYVTLSALPRFDCFTRFSGMFQMGRGPGVWDGDRHNGLMVSLKEATSNHPMTPFGPETQWPKTPRTSGQNLTAQPPSLRRKGEPKGGEDGT